MNEADEYEYEEGLLLAVRNHLAGYTFRGGIGMWKPKLSASIPRYVNGQSSHQIEMVVTIHCPDVRNDNPKVGPVTSKEAISIFEFYASKGDRDKFVDVLYSYARGAILRAIDHEVKEGVRLHGICLRDPHPEAKGLDK